MSKYRGARLLLPLTAAFIAEGTQQASKLNPDEIARKLRLDYLYSQKDLNQKALDGVQTLMEHFQRADFSIDLFMNDTLNLIRRRLWIREVTVALLDRQERMFRYVYQAGLRKEAWEAHKALRYGPDEYFNPTVYKAREISRNTSLFLAEDNPYGSGEDATFSRPVMLESRRLSADDSIEGDYFDVWVRGKDKEVVGWIEFSGTTSGKLPDTVTLKWIEIISSIVSVALLVAEARGLRFRTTP
jgi:hypothetical protein